MLVCLLKMLLPSVAFHVLLFISASTSHREWSITGSGFDVNPKSLGYTTCTYVGLNLERGSMYKKVVERISAIPEVVECHFTTGPYTMLVKLYAKDNEQLMDLLNNQLQGISGVVSTETLISLEQSIKREIPIAEELL